MDARGRPSRGTRADGSHVCRGHWRNRRLKRKTKTLLPGGHQMKERWNQMKESFCHSTHHPGLHDTRAFKYSGCVCWKKWQCTHSACRSQANHHKYTLAVRLWPGTSEEQRLTEITPHIALTHCLHPEQVQDIRGHVADDRFLQEETSRCFRPICSIYWPNARMTGNGKLSALTSTNSK